MTVYNVCMVCRVLPLFLHLVSCLRLDDKHLSHLTYQSIVYNMALNGFSKPSDNLIHVVKPKMDVRSVMKKITENGCQDEPFYVCDVNDIIRRYEDWTNIMPRIDTHYAVKCNDSRIVLETLAALGTGFDCASKEEIRKVLSLGVPPSRIIFANPTKKISHLEYAAEKGVTAMTFDSEYELHKIKKIYPTAELVLRIKYDDLTSRYILGQKYGCDHETEAAELLQLASFLGLNVIGVCFHIGSGSNDYTIYRKAIAAAREVFDQGTAIGFNFSLLDIGGGFPGEEGKSIKEIGIIVNSALQDYFPDLSVKVISEPGRYYVNTAFTLTASIHTIKKSTQADPITKKKTELRQYFVDVGVYSALVPVLFNEYYKIRPLEEDKDAQIRPSIVWGPTCDTYDKITEGVVSLPEMNVGHWMVFEETGAYTLTLSTEFNGFGAPKIHSIIDEEGWLKLTTAVAHPLPKEKFVLGNKWENFQLGLTGPDKFRTNYF